MIKKSGILDSLINNTSLRFLGQKPICNKNPDRALHIGDFVFPLCYRCMSIGIGLIVNAVIILLIRPKEKIVFLITSILLIIPCLVDGLSQLLTSYISTNPNRIILGFAAGVGIVYVCYYALCKILKLNKNN